MSPIRCVSGAPGTEGGARQESPLNETAGPGETSDRRSLVRYLIALVAVTLATLARYYLQPFVGSHHPFSTYFVAVVLAAWCGGLWPGIVTVVLGEILGTWLFVRAGPLLLDPQNLACMILYACVGVTVAVLSESLQLARSEAKHLSTVVEEQDVGLSRERQARVRAERALAHVQRDLEDEARHRIQTVAGTRAMLEQRGTSESEYIALVVHELKVPVSTITNLCTLLRDGHHGPLNGAQGQAVELTLRSADFLTTLVRDILDLAVLDAHRLSLHPQPLLIGEVIAEAVDLCQPALERPEIQIKVDPVESLPAICSDRQRITQILWNLISNAATFTDHGCILVSGWTKEGSVGIQVVDTGIGIEERDLQMLFRPFKRFSQAGSHRGGDGTGLGLYLSKKLATALGGDIRVKSKPGVGSEFTLVLPIESPCPSSTL
jgi:signal transduction histidine kinase